MIDYSKHIVIGSRLKFKNTDALEIVFTTNKSVLLKILIESMEGDTYYIKNWLSRQFIMPTHVDVSDTTTVFCEALPAWLVSQLKRY